MSPVTVELDSNVWKKLSVSIVGQSALWFIESWKPAARQAFSAVANVETVIHKLPRNRNQLSKSAHSVNLVFNADRKAIERGDLAALMSTSHW